MSHWSIKQVFQCESLSLRDQKFRPPPPLYLYIVKIGDFIRDLMPFLSCVVLKYISHNGMKQCVPHINYSASKGAISKEYKHHMIKMPYLIYPMRFELVELGNVSAIECIKKINQPCTLCGFQRLKHRMRQQFSKIVNTFSKNGC